MEKKPNSFLDYLENDIFYDKIHDSILSWCNRNKDVLIDRIKDDVKYISPVDDIDLDFENVWIDSKEDTRIEFDIAIDVTANVEGFFGGHHDSDAYSPSLWLTVSCSGSLDKKLSDFCILGVEEYSKSKPNKPLSGNFVPIIKKSSYDEYANEILDKCYFKYHPEARINPMPINVDELASRMGLTIQNTTISKDRSIFGQIFFADVEVELFNAEKSALEKRQISKNTVLVDTEAAYLRSFGSRNMTIAHECVHSYYHRKAFLFARMLKGDLHYIECQVKGVMKNAESNTTAEWMEIQANGLAPYILMPKESFVAYAKDLFKFYNQSGSLVTYTINEIIVNLANTYEVTIYAARKRLIDLGFELAIGAYNWVDNHYVKPYTFKKGFLESNETFTVSYNDVYKKIFTNQNILMAVYDNQYVFVDNHLCINDPRYIEKNQNNELILSDYALYHMDECCVKFRYNTIQGFNSGSSLGLMCYLSRDLSKEIEFDLEIVNNPAITNQSDFKERYSIHAENVAEVVKAISFISFNEIIKYLMQFLDIKTYELADDSDLDERTIRRYYNGENKKPDKRSAVALLRALNVPPAISNIALKRAGIVFVNGVDEDDALLCVLMTLRNGSPKDANTFLTSLGFAPLTQKKK